jgi:hypothetical protein
MGTAPASFNALPKIVLAASRAPGNVLDHVPLLNIAPFGMCQSPSNPVVAAATAAASGVLTPMPCIPATVSPWSPGASKVTLGGSPALTDGSTTTCLWGGTVQVTDPGQTTVQVD